MTLTIDSDLHCRVSDETCKPVVFVPDMDLLNLAEESIIDSF